MTKPRGALAASLVLCFSGIATAQQSPSLEQPPSLEQLAQLVAKAHRSDSAEKLTGFRADLRIEELAKTAEEHRGQVELVVAFLEWKHPDTGRAYPLIRYKQTDSARSIEQGRDREDFWAFADGKQLDMRSREMATDLEHARRNIQLARQMLQFVDADALLHTMKEPSGVVAEDLIQGRAAKTPCWTVRGKLASFPLRQQDGEATEVEAKAFVSRDSNLLLGLEVRPAPKAASKPQDATQQKHDAKPEDTPKGEFVMLSQHATFEGRVVPQRIVHFAVDKDGKRHVQMGIDLTTIELGKKLEASAFDRPKP